MWEVSYRFVPVKCGSRRKAPTQSPPDDLKRTKTLDDFIHEKGKERHGFLKQKKIQNCSDTATCTKDIYGQSLPKGMFRAFDKCRVVWE